VGILLQRSKEVRLVKVLLPYAEIVLGMGLAVAQLIQRRPNFLGTVEDGVEIVIAVALVAAGITELVAKNKE